MNDDLCYIPVRVSDEMVRLYIYKQLGDNSLLRMDMVKSLLSFLSIHKSHLLTVGMRTDDRILDSVRHPISFCKQSASSPRKPLFVLWDYYEQVGSPSAGSSNDLGLA